MTFITLYTPTYKRPTFLAACKASVQTQSDPDYQHMVIVDDSGIGVDGMFRDIRRHADQMRGEYVFILADDDRLYGRDSIRAVKAFAREHDNPAVIIVRNHKWGQVFPTAWRSEPQLGAIDTGNFIIRADIFRENADAFGLRYEGDFDFIHSLWKKGIPFAWFDYVFSEMQIGGKGMTEDEIIRAGQSVRVKALKSFAGQIGDRGYTVHAGDEFDLPAGTDWIRAGLVRPLTPPSPTLTPTPLPGGEGNKAGVSVETAAMAAPENAALPALTPRPLSQGERGKRKAGKP